MGLLSIFGFGSGRLREALNKGAVVIDVRTAAEFDRGKAPDSIHIPIDRIPVNVERILSMKKPVIFVCSSGARSAKAVALLKEKGKKDVYNGGSWEKVAKLVRGH